MSNLPWMNIYFFMFTLVLLVLSSLNHPNKPYLFLTISNKSKMNKHTWQW